MFSGETFNSQFASGFVSFDAVTNTYTKRILFFLLFPRIVKNHVFRERHENAKEKREKKKKLISNTVQNALDK